MLTIRGTRHADYLDYNQFDHPGAWTVRGWLGNDEIIGNGDRLYGDAGDDSVWDQGPGGYAFGGAGNDSVMSYGGEAWGGRGNDMVSAYTLAIGEQEFGALAVGGAGNDAVYGSGTYGAPAYLYGDEGPGLAQKTVGNDFLHSDIGATATLMNGGLGGDVFDATSLTDRNAGFLTVTDFRHGEDAIRADAWAETDTGPVRTGWAELLAKLDADHDGVLGWHDSVGADNDWSTPDGGAVYTDGQTLYLGLNATVAGTTGTDATHWLVVQNTDHLAISGDFLV